MIAFIDTEVAAEDKRVVDIGVVRDDGAVLHTQSIPNFADFIAPCRVLCGHNILHHDLKYLQVCTGDSLHLEHRYLIDTLCLSPLLFPKKPYHRLLKDDKLQADELNNPVNDARKSQQLFDEELAAWQSLPVRVKMIYRDLLHSTHEFAGFFDYIVQKSGFAIPASDGIDATTLADLIKETYRGLICANSNVAAVVGRYPVELAYSLAVIGADDLMAVVPPWVSRTYPKVANVMQLLRNEPCGHCDYCQKRLDAHSALREFFGYDKFREFESVPMQQQAVEAAIRGESLLTIFPTGGGKSLTFQLPALIAGRNMHGLTVVISPLQSLMKDQVDNLLSRGLATAVTINGLLDPLERASAVAQVADGTADLLYIAPEMLRSKTIERILMGRHVVRFVIDEAHCFSAWGQDFRVDYLYIGDFIRNLQECKMQRQPIAVSCFTATAKQKVISDICDYFKRKLGINLKIFAASAKRENLRYSVLHADTDESKYSILRNLILSHHCPSIVYVSRTKRTREIADHLKSDGVAALPFNGKMQSDEKVKNQNSFMSGETQVIVATSAFGMGVDKKDVGLVVHYDISDSLENYVQEAGRAGRDPHMEAECYVLFSDGDLDKHFLLLNQTKLSIGEIQQVWKVIKDSTRSHTHVSCSPLEIARQAGWNDDAKGVETRVKAAIAALENAGFIERKSNVPYVFATGIRVRNMDEARMRLTNSPLFDEHTREEAARIIHSLISCRATHDEAGESRVDYLADILGIPRDAVMRNVALMRQEGILADSHDMQAWIENAGTKRSLESALKLENYVHAKLVAGNVELNYKLFNEEAHENGLKFSTVKRIKTILNFLALKGYIRKEEHIASGTVSIRTLESEQSPLQARFFRRVSMCRHIVERLLSTLSTANTVQIGDYSAVSFSVLDMLESYKDCSGNLLTQGASTPSIIDVEESLLYLSRTGVLRIEGGFMVIYNTVQLNRTTSRKARFGKEQYRLLDEFYRQRIQQIHIVGEYANLMVRDYAAALRFVNDYFQMDYREFVRRYFKGAKAADINRNITPSKYHRLFGMLSKRQLEIVNDSHSAHILVAAGPGSGKTRLLVHKLASLLLLEDVKHEQLLMLTFSRSSATEFKMRLIELVGNAAHFVDIKTFHSYSFDILGMPGNTEELHNVVLRAAQMIENGEVEESRIAKSVLVIDEAQDMSEDDFRLVKALMSQNANMRVIAVGDDDQNIYSFRGSSSAYMQSLATDYGATLYEMTENYRSAEQIVALANSFAALIPSRMKRNAVVSLRGDVSGIAEIHRYDCPGFCFPPIDFAANGSTAVLTATNEQAMQAAYRLKCMGYKPRLIQSLDGFRFINLAEVRYFMKQIGNDGAQMVSRSMWDYAKERTLKAYECSSCIDIIQRFFTDFEKIHPIIYRSDLEEFLFESNVEDFVYADAETVTVSTIHKSKGREYDTVYMLADFESDGVCETDAAALRALYVGMTRARQRLYIHTSNRLFDGLTPPATKNVHTTIPQSSSSILIPLGYRDIRLSSVKNFKASVLNLRSGDSLMCDGVNLFSRSGDFIASLSSAMCDKLLNLKRKSYHVVQASVSYIVAWRPRDETVTYAVPLATLRLEKANSPSAGS